MRKLLQIWTLVMLLVLCALPAVTLADDNAIGTRVFDDAGLFSGQQRVALNEQAQGLILKYRQDIVIVTTADAGGKNAQEYADDYYDYNDFGIGPEADGLLLLIDMDNREFFITTTGSAIKLFNASKIESMLDNIYAYVGQGDYAGGAGVFLRDVERHLSKKAQPRYWNWAFFVVGLFAIFMVLGRMFMNHRKGLMSAPSIREYINTALCEVTRRDDIFLHSSTRRIRINNSSGSGGGGSGTRTSSSGRTHGGSGRRF